MTRLKGVLAVLLLPLSVLALLAFYGCDTTPATPTPPSQPPGGGDVNAVINAAHQTMLNLKSFHFTVHGDKAGTPTLDIEGDLERPNKVHSTYQQPSQEKGELVVFGKDTYLKQPTATAFTQSQGGNDPPEVVGTLLDPEAFTYYALLGSNQKLAGEENIDGVDTSHVTFTFSPNQAQSRAAELAAQPTPAPQSGSDADFKGDMWVEKGTNYVRRIEWRPPPAGEGTPDAGLQRVVTINYSKFNEPVNPPIQPPNAYVTKTPSPVPQPTATIVTGLNPATDTSMVPPTHTTTQQLAPQVFASGGLGLAKEVWTQQHGQPNRINSDILANYEADKYIVLFWYAGDYPIQSILRQFPDGQPFDLENAQAEAHAMLPTDAKFVKTVREPSTIQGVENVVELYDSRSLTNRYLPSNSDGRSFDWLDGSPGTITITYQFDGNGWQINAGYSKE